MTEDYLQILEESLHKKLEVLKRIENLCDRQETLFRQQDWQEEELDNCLEEKGLLIEELNELDEGFECLYENIRTQLASGKERYSTQIVRLQEMITVVTEKSVGIQVMESRNHTLAEQFFSKNREQLQKGRRNSRAALDYYRNMNRSQVVLPQFMDKKK